MSELKTAIPKGSWVLVTGITGFVASHVVKQFLERGYKVRGTVRDASKATWLVDEVFKSYADNGDFELVSVPDLGADNAFDEAVKGVSAIAHVASIVTIDPDPNNVIPQTVAGTTSILHAALREPSVQQFVYTSSCVTAVLLGEKCHVERDTWNEMALQLAWSPPPYVPQHGFIVYMASKVAAEKAVWEFVKEKKPHFAVNCINPGTVLGKPLHEKYIRSTGSWIPRLYDGETSQFSGLAATVAIDAEDVALLHAAVVLDPEVNNARLQVWGRHCTWNDVLAILRKLRPQHKFIPNLPNSKYLECSTDFTESFDLLKKWAGQDGWRPLEETLADNLVYSTD